MRGRHTKKLRFFLRSRSTVFHYFSCCSVFRHFSAQNGRFSFSQKCDVTIRNFENLKSQNILTLLCGNFQSLRPLILILCCGGRLRCANLAEWHNWYDPEQDERPKNTDPDLPFTMQTRQSSRATPARKYNPDLKKMTKIVGIEEKIASKEVDIINNRDSKRGVGVGLTHTEKLSIKKLKNARKTGDLEAEAEQCHENQT